MQSRPKNLAGRHPPIGLIILEARVPSERVDQGRTLFAAMARACNGDPASAQKLMTFRAKWFSDEERERSAESLCNFRQLTAAREPP